MADQLFMKDITLATFLKKSAVLLKNTWYSITNIINQKHIFLIFKILKFGKFIAFKCKL